MLPVVALVGRPNVGKSTLFNRLLGEQRAIVHNTPGVTRDRHYGESFWNGVDFTVIDTGGIIPDDPDKINAAIRDHAALAIDEADVILLITDVEEGVHPLDEAVAEMLRRQPKPVIVVANKADTEKKGWGASEFYSLGIEHIFPISSATGSGTGDLLDEVVKRLPERDNTGLPEIPKLAFVGRPNVGKSSIVNALLGNERSIVSDVAGTTRDTINSYFEFNDKPYMLLDTAGLRRKTRVKESVEFFSTVRTDRAIRECDVAIVMLDATLGLEAQDIRILNEGERYNKGLIIAINKWDLIEKETNTLKEYEQAIRRKIPSYSYVPIISTSATSGLRVVKLLDVVERVLEEREKKISTSKLNEFVKRVLKERPLPLVQRRPLKLNYTTQVKAKPPVFLFFMNNPKAIPADYRKYLERQMREEFGFEGVPLTLSFREKN